MKAGRRMLISVLVVFPALAWAAGMGSTDASTADAQITYTWFLPENELSQVSYEWPVYQELVKRTGINIEFVAVPSANANEKRRVLIATNEVTDIMYIDCREASQVGPDGVFLPLDELVDSNAPNLNALWNEWGVADIARTMARSAVDGKIYSLPVLELEKGQFRRNWFIRRDLMEQYGWRNPKTDEEYYDILVKFKEKFPGSSPLAIAGTGDFFLGMTIAFTGIESNNGIGFDWETETYEFVPDRPGFKEMIQFANKLIREGLMDQEWAAMNSNQLRERIVADKSFASYSWRTRGEQTRLVVDSVDPNSKFDFFAMAPWAAPTGRAATPGREVVQSAGWAFSAEIKRPEKAMALCDYMFSKEGRELMNYGPEGVAYNIENGKYIPVVGFDNPTNETMRRIGAAYDGFRGTALPELVSLVDGYPPDIQERDAIIAPSLMPPYKVLPETQTINELEKENKTNVATYFSQQVAKMVMGQIPITDSELSAMKKELERLGARELVAAYNEAYTAAYK